MTRDVEPIPKSFEGLGPKKRKRLPAATVDPEYVKARAVVRERSGGRCEARTEECRGAATQVHHRAGRGFDGCHDPRLLLAVCGLAAIDGCHGAAHQHPDWAKRHGLFDNHNPDLIDLVRCPLSCEIDHRENEEKER